MELFWQFFATAVISLLIGIQLGRSTAISQMLLQQQQHAAQQMPQFMMPGMGGQARPGTPPPGNGPA